MVLHLHSGMCSLVIFAVCWRVIKINLFHLKHIIVDLKRINLKTKLLWYRRVYIKTLLYILANNIYIGHLFLILLVFNFPINCYILIRMKNSSNMWVTTFIGFFFIEQVVVIFGIHWLIASLNSEFNKNIKFAISRFVPNSCLITKFSCANFILNLKISLFIQNYRSTSKYGFTYGRFGLISLMAFTKVR